MDLLVLEDLKIFLVDTKNTNVIAGMELKQFEKNTGHLSWNVRIT